MTQGHSQRPHLQGTDLSSRPISMIKNNNLLGIRELNHSPSGYAFVYQSIVIFYYFFKIKMYCSLWGQF